jgi:hypothetical protein
MRASLGLMCIVACGVAAGVLLWLDRDPAGQPALQSARAQARPAEPDRPAFAGLAPRPSLTPAVEARSPEPTLDPAPDRAPGAAPDTQASGEDEIAVTRALVRASLERDIPRKLPELTLSAGDLERLSDTVLRVREHHMRLRGLAHTIENAAEIRRLETELVHDLLVFEEVTGMSATELTGALSDEGITTEEQADAEKPVYWTLPE